MQKIECTCVNTRVGTVAVKGGIKLVLVMALASTDGEILTKFFNCQKTAKGNITVSRNSDYARLYRLTIGENPSARFSRADRLLNHFMGCRFNVEFVPALDKKNREYLKVTSISPAVPILSDGWTQTGHVIKNVRTKSKNLAKNCQRFDNIMAKSCQFSGNSNSALSHTPQGLKHDLYPIQHPPYQVETSHILLIKDINSIKKEKAQNRPPPLDLDQSLGQVINSTIH